MNAHTTIAKPAAGSRQHKRRLTVHIAAATPQVATPPKPEPCGIVPSSPEPIALRLLRRAAENVRHTRIDEDVEQLADDIEAHGLLTSLIGYRDAFEPTFVEIVGGGRRLQALRSLRDRALIADDFPVPVLIRDASDAIELSLAENLQQRKMSPVDEFFAFRALMERGTWSPEILAKRFGFSTRIVKQRLRLAELEPEVLDALSAKTITIDAAMAYASSQDRDLQRAVFKTETKKSGSYAHAHRPDDIRHALRAKGATTDDPLYRFVGPDSYERRGGGYEDDLFIDGKDAGKVLTHPHILQTAAEELIDFQMIARLRDFQERADLAETITGYVVTNDLRIKSYDNASVAPKGFERVEKYDHAPVWKTIRHNRIDARVLVGIDSKGELVVEPRVVFVPKAQRDAVSPPAAQPVFGNSQTPEQRVAAERLAGVALKARRLAVGLFAGTPFEGRAFWPVGYYSEGQSAVRDGVSGWMVPVEIFVTDAAIAAAMPDAEVEYDIEAAKSAAADARIDELRALDPPALVVIDGLLWARAEEGSYAPDDELEEGFFGSWTGLLANAEPDEINATWATREAYDAAMADYLAADEASA